MDLPLEHQKIENFGTEKILYQNLSKHELWLQISQNLLNLTLSTPQEVLNFSIMKDLSWPSIVLYSLE